MNKDKRKDDGNGGGEEGAGLASFEEYREKSRAAGVM